MKNIFVNIFALTLLSVLFFFCSSANAAEPVGYARVSGYVKDTVTKASLDEANVRLKCGNENQDTDTNSSGYYEFPSVPIYKNNNTYISQTRIIVSSGEYKTEMNWTDLVPGQNYTADFYLETRFKYPLVSGQVIDKDTSVGIEGATVTVSNEKENYSCLTDAGGHYTLRIEHKGVGEYTAYAAADNYQASETQTITTYPTKTYTLNFSCVMAADLPPSAPQGLTLANSDGLVQLSWTANTEPDLSGYNVYRAEVSGGPYIKLNTLPLSQSLYTDSGLNNGTIYHYVVTAVDTAGNESDYSQENSAMPSEWLTIMQDRPDAFSPNNDGTCDVSVLTYELIRDALITLSVYDAANQPVRVWEENIAKTSGTHTVEWNGCNDNAEVLPDGAYTYVVKAQDALGGWSQKQAQVTIDNHFMQITEPVDNELYLGERLTLIAVVSAYVHNISDVYFYYRSKGDTDWTVFDKTLVLREDGSYELYLGSANTHHDEFEVCVSASYIDLNNEVRTEYSTPVTYVFSEKITVLRASDSPDAFSPNGSGDFDESIITYEIINAEGFITTKIYDGNNNLIKVLERQSPKTIGTHTVIWNGRSRIDGDFAPDGTYTYVITAEDGEGNRHEKQGEVSLDNHFMRIVEPLPETLLMGEVTFKAVPSPYTRDIANVHFLFSPEGTSQTTGYEAALQPDGTWSCVWNADNAQSGRYGVRVSAYYTDLNNQFRCELTKFDMFTVPDYVRISDVFDENDAFSPNEDGNYDTAMIHYQISRDALMSVELFDAGKTLVRTLKQDVSEPGMYVVEWDGRDDASNVLDEGTYTYVITAKTPAEGYVSQKQGTLSIDNHPLVISPAPGSVVSGNVIFTLMPSEYIKSVYRVFLYYRLKGESTFYSLTDVMTGAPQDTDGTYKVNWDTESIINGDYEIEARIEYRDLSNGNREDIFSPLNYTVSNPILIFDVSDAPDPFSPNEDFISDTTTISYQLVNSGANVSIKIYDGEGVLVRVLKENVSEQQGVQSAVWDGKGSNESIVSDGIYTYRIEAADAQGNTAQKQGQVTVDNHAVTIIEPQEGGVVSSDVVLRAVPSAFCQNVRSIYFSVRHTASYVYFRKSLGPAVQDSDGNWTVQWSTADIPAGEYELYARISFIDNNGQMRSENSARIRCTLATGNMLSYISDAPDAFSPNGDGKYDISTISYVLSIGSSVNLKIYDAQGLLVRTLKENETQTIGFNNNLWDGKNDNGNILPDGMYSYIIEADFQGICQDQEQGTIAVDNQIASFIQPVPDSSLSGAVTLKIMPSPYMSDVTGIRMETTPGGGLGAAVKQSDGNWEAVWDTTGYSNGSYNVRAYVTFMDLNGKGRGEWTKAQVYTIANGMAVSRNAFSPNADAYYDTTAFLYNMASAGAVTVKIYDANQNPVRTIKENIFEQVGANQAVWNGKDNNANVLGDGTYSYVIDIDYGSGNTAQQEGTVAIDNHFLRITQPAAGDSLNSTVNLTVAPSAYVGNIDMRRVRFYYRKKGDTTWQHQTFNWLYQQPDGSWQLVWDVSALVNVEYELCVSATYNDLNNLARTETSLPVTYKIANPFSLINVSDAPDAFSPNGDNNSDTTTIKYFINSDALVTISIYDAGGNLLRTLKENILETAGNHTAVWGGKDQNGLTLNDGTYAYVIEATDNQSNKLQQSGESSIDNNVIRITEPAPDSTISGNVKLKINFSSFVLSERGICLQTTSLMNNFIVYGAKDIDGSWSIPIDTKIIPNGPFEFKIIAGYYDLNNVSRYEIIYCAYTVFNAGPDIADLTVTPNPFSPDGSGTWLDPVTGEVFNDPAPGLVLDDIAAISFTASDYGFFDVHIEDITGTIVKQIAKQLLYPEPVTQRIELSWAGDRTGWGMWRNLYVHNGEYRLVVMPFDTPAKMRSIPIIVDKKPFIRNVNFGPNPFTPASESEKNRAILSFDLTDECFVNVGVYSEDILVFSITEHLKISGDLHYSYAWDGTDGQGNILAPGKYILRITAESMSGNPADPVEITAFISSPVGGCTDVRIDNVSIDPYQGQTVSIMYNLSEEIALTLTIYDDYEQPVRHLVNNELRSQGENSEIWGGKNDNGEIVPDGIYYFVIETVVDGNPVVLYNSRDTGGGNISKEIPFTLSGFDPYKNQFCVMSYDVFEPVFVTIRIRYERYAGAAVRVFKYEEPTGPGHYEAYWDGRDEQGDFVNSTTPYIALWAYTADDNSIIVGGGTPRILNVCLTPVRFNPYPNAYREVAEAAQAELSFDLSQDAYLTAAVYDTRGIAVRVLKDNEFLTQGHHVLYWDGKNNNGEFVKNGYYRFMLQAHNGVNYSEPVTRHVELFF